MDDLEDSPSSAGPFSGHPAAAVFVKGAATAFVADSAAHQIVRIAGLDGAPVTDAVLTSGEYVREPAGIALSEDNARIFLADRGTTTIRIFDASSGMLMNELSADLAPLSLTPLAASRFLLNTDSFRDSAARISRYCVARPGVLRAEGKLDRANATSAVPFPFTRCFPPVVRAVCDYRPAKRTGCRGREWGWGYVQCSPPSGKASLPPSP